MTEFQDAFGRRVWVGQTVAYMVEKVWTLGVVEGFGTRGTYAEPVALVRRISTQYGASGRMWPTPKRTVKVSNHYMVNLQAGGGSIIECINGMRTEQDEADRS